MSRFECPKEVLDGIKALVEANINLNSIAKNTTTCTIPRDDKTYVIKIQIKSREKTIEELRQSIHKNINKIRG
jgi:hypothetical protein